MPMTCFRLAASALLAASLAACAGNGGVATSPAPQASTQPSAEDARLAAIARARADSALHLYTAADARFMSGMIGHHSQAIVMAGWAASHGASPEIRTLAGRIINAQQDEIALMTRWLTDRNLPVPAGHDHAAMVAHGDHDAGLMPGMLTAAQMNALDAARGPEFDRLFLTGMIQHHSGAVAMVKTLFGSYGAGQDEAVFKFASDVNVDQTTEIARMEKMLAALPAARAP